MKGFLNSSRAHTPGWAGVWVIAKVAQAMGRPMVNIRSLPTSNDRMNHHHHRSLIIRMNNNTSSIPSVLNPSLRPRNKWCADVSRWLIRHDATDGLDNDLYTSLGYYCVRLRTSQVRLD
jgi:hypothetical protein